MATASLPFQRLPQYEWNNLEIAILTRTTKTFQFCGILKVVSETETQNNHKLKNLHCKYTRDVLKPKSQVTQTS